MENRTETSQFLLRLCHDLKSSLRGVNAHTQLLRRNLETKPPAQLRESLGFVVGSAQTLDRLIDRLAAYAIALETTAAPFQRMSMEVLLRGALARMESLLQETGAEVTHRDLPAVEGNPDRLMQVFEELIRNAVVHRGTAPARIEVKAERQDDHWLFVVRDHGPGVESADLERIFRPLEKISGAGAGFGLAICKAVIEAHGGRIWAELPPGGGLEVRFTLRG